MELAPRPVFAAYDFRKRIATTDTVKKAKGIADIALSGRVGADDYSGVQ